ncbi:uridine kinase family protein [Aestuariimicrobium ganziense]|uniref:uridine kinase family protein n=1 Tax=Aestuariimicrobium ganziense TaxID=2773677 RepID=UPI002E2E0F85|nr:uridine kinase [Aestuariimicrobium ganziense]
MSHPARRLVLVAGPSGSGKSRLSRLTGLPQLRLDDFYLDDDHPDMPRSDLGIIDWDDVASWDLPAAVAALESLMTTGRAEVPVYEISLNRAVGTRTFDLEDAPVVLCEGIFAPDLLAPCRVAGLQPLAIWLDRPRLLNFVRRLARDLRERRKPPLVLVRRGWQLMADEPALRRRALGLGFQPMSMKEATRVVAGTGAA